MVEVTEADREAAKGFFSPGRPEQACLRGVFDNTPTVQAFAAHRIAATSAKDKRIAELEAALQGLIDDEPCRHDHHGYCQTHFVTAPCEMAAARKALTP